jgi:hypothetical protein
MFNSEDERVCAFCGLSIEKFEECEDRIAELEEHLRRCQEAVNQLMRLKSKEEIPKRSRSGVRGKE